MNKQTIERYNMEQLESRKGLPSFIEALKMARKGNKDVLDMYYYYEMRLETHYYDGRKVVATNYYFIHMDRGVNYFLNKMKKNYCDNSVITTSSNIGNNNFKVNTSSKKFDADEIETLFIEYMNEFVGKHDISNFEGENELHTYNKVLDFIKKDFENNVLKRLYRERMGIKRVQVENETYTVKNYVEEVFIEDIGNATSKEGQSSEEGALSFAEIVSNEDVRDYYRNDDSDFIYENYREVLTKKQLEKLDKVLAWLDEGNDVNELFEKNNPQKLSKTALSKILMPERDTKGTMTELNNFISSMRKRMDKALNKGKCDKVESSFNTFNDASNEANKVFKEYQLEKLVVGYESKFPQTPFYMEFIKPNKCYTPTPFIEVYDIEAVKYGRMSIKDLISKYGITKNTVGGKNSDIITLNTAYEGDTCQSYVSEMECEKLLESHLNGILQRIQNGTTAYTLDTNTGMVTYDTEYLNPIPHELVRYLEGYTLTKGMEVLREYYNKDTYNPQPRKLKIVDVKEVSDLKKTTKYLTPNELQSILNKKNNKE